MPMVNQALGLKQVMRRLLRIDQCGCLEAGEWAKVSWEKPGRWPSDGKSLVRARSRKASG